MYALNGYNGERWHINTLVFVFSEVKLCIRLAEQVTDFLVINLEVGGSHQELLLGVCIVVQVPVDMLEGIGNDAAVFFACKSHHSVCFTATSLTIREYCAVIARQS